MSESSFNQPGSQAGQIDGIRYDRNDAREMLGRMPMGELMGMAHHARMRHHPRRWVTFVVDTNPNYTNICVTCCDFCAFFRRDGHTAA